LVLGEMHYYLEQLNLTIFSIIYKNLYKGQNTLINLLLRIDLGQLFGE